VLPLVLPCSAQPLAERGAERGALRASEPSTEARAGHQLEFRLSESAESCAGDADQGR
jgi:hypothetical protein